MSKKKNITILVIITLIISQFSMITVFAANDYDSVIQEVIYIINQQRMEEGLEPLTTSGDFQEAAKTRVNEVIAENDSSTRPDGTEFYTVFDEYGIDVGYCGEETYMGLIKTAQQGSERILSGEDCFALSEHYSSIGIGIKEADGEIHWVVLYSDYVGDPVEDFTGMSETTQDTEDESESQNEDLTIQYILEVINLVNEERAKEGLGALDTTEKLIAASQLRAVEQVELFSHTRPDGSSWSTALDEYDIPYATALENIAYGQTTPKAVVESWMNSPGHRRNILNEEVNKIGVGFYVSGTTPYWAQLFVKNDQPEILDINQGMPDVSTPPVDEEPEVITESSESGNIKSVEVSQIMGKGQSIDNGSIYNMRSFVAGKNTAVLVPLNNPVTVDPSGNTQYVTVTKEGNEIGRLRPINPAGKTDLIEFLPSSIKAVNNWEAGNYTFTAVIDDDESSVGVKFEERMTMRVLAVPVIGNWNGDVNSTEGKWKTAGKFTQTVYPLKNGGLIWELGQELDLSDSKYDLTTNDGMYEVWKALANLQTRDNKYTLIVGFVRDRQGPKGYIQGYTYGLPANIVTESDEDMMATVAHEIGHCYDLGDEYTYGAINMSVNPAPFGMEGTDYYTYEEIVANKEFIEGGDAWTYGDGSIVFEEQNAYEPYGRGLLGDVVSYMGSGASQSKYWTTSASWEHLFDSFAHTGKGVSSDQGMEDEEEWIDLIEISGTVYQDGSVSLYPSYQYEGLWEDVEEVSGKGYSVVFLDKDENELDKAEFGVSFRMNTNPPRVTDKAPFNLTLEYPQDTKFLEIREGAQVIQREEVTENKPEVTLRPITGGNKEISGKHTIEWDGKDKDGDDLYYEIWYEPNDYDWMLLAKDITETSLEVDFDALPGGEEALLYIFATDGINTSYAESDFFPVAYKAPEILTEQDQPEGLKVTDELFYVVDVYDAQDGYLYEPGEIVWKDKKGKIVSEDDSLLFFPYELSIGEHTFTMTATNSGGISVLREYSFVIEDDESALPQSWSRDEFKEAMILGLVEPSLMYGYKNSGSKIDLAMTSVNLFIQIVDEDSIEEIDTVIEELSDESPYTDYDDKEGYAELAVKLGFATAEGDKFEPQRTVTRSEVVDAFCEVLAKEGYDIYEEEWEFTEEYIDIETLTGASRTNMAFFNEYGIIKGDDRGKLSPFETASREEIVVIAKRLFDIIME